MITGNAVAEPISIHAPVKGATSTDASKRSTKDFNPRSREGSDSCGYCNQLPLDYFNPRSREGSDWFRPLFIVICDNFNPRSREGSDLCRLHSE